MDGDTQRLERLSLWTFIDKMDAGRKSEHRGSTPSYPTLRTLSKFARPSYTGRVDNLGHAVRTHHWNQPSTTQRTVYHDFAAVMAANRIGAVR